MQLQSNHTYTTSKRKGRSVLIVVAKSDVVVLQVVINTRIGHGVMVLEVTFYNVIIGQKESSLFNNSNGFFFSIHLNCNGIWAEGAVKGLSLIHI